MISCLPKISHSFFKVSESVFHFQINSQQQCLKLVSVALHPNVRTWPPSKTVGRRQGATSASVSTQSILFPARWRIERKLIVCLINNPLFCSWMFMDLSQFLDLYLFLGCSPSAAQIHASGSRNVILRMAAQIANLADFEKHAQFAPSASFCSTCFRNSETCEL